MINAPDLQQISTELATYSSQLAHCIEAQLWEELLEVLVKRQRYFESLDAHTEALKAAGIGDIIQQMLKKDDTFIANVSLQKDKLAQEHLDLIHSRQAVKAYQ